jgi:hypothetical protein
LFSLAFGVGYIDVVRDSFTGFAFPAGMMLAGLAVGLLSIVFLHELKEEHGNKLGSF